MYNSAILWRKGIVVHNRLSMRGRLIDKSIKTVKGTLMKTLENCFHCLCADIWASGLSTNPQTVR